MSDEAPKWASFKGEWRVRLENGQLSIDEVEAMLWSEYEVGWRDGAQYGYRKGRRRAWIGALVPIAVTAIVLLLCMAAAHAMSYTPLAYPECLQRDCWRDLRAAGAERWETQALCDFVASGSIGKSLVDYIRVSERELALGIAHFTARRGRLGLTPPRPHCSDLEHYWRALSLLYSDQSASVQLSAWRRLVRPALDEGRKWGLPPVVVSALANSGPGAVTRQIRDCRGDACCVARAYAQRSPHRLRRVVALGLGVCLPAPAVQTGGGGQTHEVP